MQAEVKMIPRCFISVDNPSVSMIVSWINPSPSAPRPFVPLENNPCRHRYAYPSFDGVCANLTERSGALSLQLPHVCNAKNIIAYLRLT